MDTQDYLEISISVPSEELSEIVEAQISDLGFDTFMYDDAVLKAYIQSEYFTDDSLRSVLSELGDMLGCALSYKVVKMPSVNWNSQWEQSGFTPIVVDDKLSILPVGAEPLTPLSIYLRPEMAFGTGHHHTTYMMMQSILSLGDFVKNSRVVDLGCGTAILALLASKLGSCDVLGIDIDEVAVRSARENVILNGEDFPVICGTADDLKTDSCDLLLANIHKNILIDNMPAFAACLKPGGHLLVSGFYDTDAGDVIGAALSKGFVFSSQRVSEGWTCVDLILQ